MLSDCLKCRNNTQSKNPTVVKTKKGRIMLLSKCVVGNSKKSKFRGVKSRGVINNLTEVKIPILSDLPLIKAFFKSKK